MKFSHASFVSTPFCVIVAPLSSLAPVFIFIRRVVHSEQFASTSCTVRAVPVPLSGVASVWIKTSFIILACQWILVYPSWTSRTCACKVSVCVLATPSTIHPPIAPPEWVFLGSLVASSTSLSSIPCLACSPRRGWVHWPSCHTHCAPVRATIASCSISCTQFTDLVSLASSRTALALFVAFTCISLQYRFSIPRWVKMAILGSSLTSDGGSPIFLSCSTWITSIWEKRALIFPARFSSWRLSSSSSSSSCPLVPSSSSSSVISPSGASLAHFTNAETSSIRRAHSCTLRLSRSILALPSLPVFFSGGRSFLDISAAATNSWACVTKYRP